MHRVHLGLAMGLCFIAAGWLSGCEQCSEPNMPVDPPVDPGPDDCPEGMDCSGEVPCEPGSDGCICDVIDHAGCDPLGPQPICDVDDRACRPCASHLECRLHPDAPDFCTDGRCGACGAREPQGRNGCADDAPICVSGAAVSFLVYGNASVDISVLPAEMAEVGGKKVGVFKAVSDDPKLAPLYYDMEIVVVPEDPKASAKPEAPLEPLSIKELSASEQAWSSSLDLASGLHRAKVYVRPVIDWNDPENIVSPGEYVASISLSIASR